MTPRTPPPPPVDTRCLEQRPGGWRLKLRDPTRPGKWMPSRLYPDVRDAAQYRDGVRAYLSTLREEGQLPEPDSLQQFGDELLDELDAAGDTRSIDTMRSQWNAHVVGTPLAVTALARVTSVAVRAFAEALVKKPVRVPAKGGGHADGTRKVSRSTASKVLSLVRQVLERAVERGRIRQNPAKGVTVRAGRVRHDEAWTYLTLDEIARLAALAAIPAACRTIYLVAIYTGLRQGELWGLHWRDVHMKGARPELVVRFSRRGPPKNGKVRRVPLLKPALELLKKWKLSCPASAEGLVFPTRTGEMRAKGDDARWADYYVPTAVKGQPGQRVNVLHDGYVKRLELGRPARFHDLRHTCASHLVMGSWGVVWTLPEIAAFLGHSDTEVTERYAHLSPEYLHTKAAKTARALGTETVFPTCSQREAPLHETPGFLARPRGLEPLTSRSVGPRQGERSPSGNPPRGTDREQARSLLEAAASGQVPEAAIQALCYAVLDAELARAAEPLLEALRLLWGPAADPHRVRRAAQLAVAVLNPTTTASTGVADSADSADSHY